MSANNFIPNSITCIVTCHAEGTLVHRTLLSLERARERALPVQTEILIVLDRANEATKRYFAGRVKGPLDRVVECDLGDAGLARNFGVTQARGEYIAIMDGDDLVCDDWFSKCFALNEKLGARHILHSQWILTFGRAWTAWRQLDQASDECFVTNFLTQNYWSALCFAHRSVFEDIGYQYADPKHGYGYEDMHWNCETIVKGYQHVSVPETVHFVRLKESQSRNLNHVRDKTTIPPSKLFSAEVFARFFLNPGREEKRPSKVKAFLSAHVRDAGRSLQNVYTDTCELIGKARRRESKQALNFYARRTVMSYLRAAYFLTLRPFVHASPAVVRDTLWSSVSHVYGLLGMTKSAMMVPPFLVRGMIPISEIEPELFPSDNVLRKINHVPPLARELELAKVYLRLLKAVGNGVDHLLLLPEHFDEKVESFLPALWKQYSATETWLVVSLNAKYESLAPTAPRYVRWFPMYEPIEHEPRFAEMLGRALLQTKYRTVHVVLSSALGHLVNQFVRPVRTLGEMHVIYSPVADTDARAVALNAVYDRAAWFSSLSVPDEATRTWLFATYGPFTPDIQILPSRRVETPAPAGAFGGSLVPATE